MGKDQHVDGLSTVQVCRVAGVTYRQLDHWARTGLLSPEIVDARGSGSARRYSVRDAAIAHVLAQMSFQGVPFTIGRRVVDVLRADPAAWDGFLVVVDGAVVVTYTPGAVLADHRTVAAWVLAPAAALVEIAGRLDSQEVSP